MVSLEPLGTGLVLEPAANTPGIDPSRGRFQSYRCRADHLGQFFRRVTGSGPPAAEFMPIVQLLSRCCAGDFADLVELKAQACGRDHGAPSAATIWAMRDLFLAVPNRRLQRLYGDYFTDSPVGPGMRHEEKIAALDNVRDRAQDIVAAYDWRWLADWLRLDLIGETAESCLLRLSNFAFAVKRINFRLTYHCNISCRHCYNSSGPHEKAQHIALDSMRAIIAQAPAAGITALNLTGGEPFLYPDEVLTLIADGRAAHLREISICTNGFWAETPEKAEHMLARLAAAGFMQQPRDHLQVSAGVYHQEFIELERVCLLANVHYRMFGRRLRVDFELTQGGRRQADEAAVRQTVAAAGAEHCISLHFRTLDAVGRAKDLADATLGPIESPCRAIDQIAFDPDGAVRPCCGLNNRNNGIKIGELQHHRLRDLVKRMQNDPVLQFLARNPMSAIFAHVDVEKKAAGYAGKCSLCQHALGHLTDKEKLQAQLFAQQEFYPFWFTQPTGIQ
jgi:MoaA/NifB/PqqE/SkfB family radical SAM enzyme